MKCSRAATSLWGNDGRTGLACPPHGRSGCSAAETSQHTASLPPICMTLPTHPVIHPNPLHGFVSSPCPSQPFVRPGGTRRSQLEETSHNHSHTLSHGPRPHHRFPAVSEHGQLQPHRQLARTHECGSKSTSSKQKYPACQPSNNHGGQIKHVQLHSAHIATTIYSPHQARVRARLAGHSSQMKSPA